MAVGCACLLWGAGVPARGGTSPSMASRLGLLSGRTALGAGPVRSGECLGRRAYPVRGVLGAPRPSGQGSV
eukprot:360702-Chlamydomonas_euryale.AAC.4